MEFSDAEREYLQKARSAAMVTLRADGMPHVVRVGVALVDGKLWSSGTETRVRTRHLRRDPRATVYVIDQGFQYLTVESHVTLIEGPDVPRLSQQLFEVMQAGMPHREHGTLMWYGKEISPGEFQKAMVDERRLIYQFDPLRTYGLSAAAAR
jgi:PPOX class probable F420-dependent enzyme